MRTLRRNRLGVAWLAIVALCGNLLAGAFAFPPLERAGDPSDLLGPLVICTDHGAQALPPEGPDRSAAPSSHCPACLAAAAFAFIAVQPAMLFVSWTPARAFARHSPPPVLATALRRSGLGSRAPPLPA